MQRFHDFSLVHLNMKQVGGEKESVKEYREIVISVETEKKKSILYTFGFFAGNSGHGTTEFAVRFLQNTL